MSEISAMGGVLGSGNPFKKKKKGLKSMLDQIAPAPALPGPKVRRDIFTSSGKGGWGKSGGDNTFGN
jgi:Mrp family chromosome partitioning ATPase